MSASNLQSELVSRMKEDPSHGEGLLGQRLQVPEQRVLAQVDVNARRSRIAELLWERVNTMSGSYHILMSQ